MATLKLDRKRPDAAIPQLEYAINNLLPMGVRIKTTAGPPGIGNWSLVSSEGELKEYERKG